MMCELKDIMPVKSILDSNVECDGEILVCCTNIWVSEESLCIPYAQLIHSYWSLYSKEQDIIKIEENNFESEDCVNKFINSEEYLNSETCYSMEINKVSIEESSTHGGKEYVCQLHPFHCETCNKSARSSELNPHGRSHTGEKTFKCQTCFIGCTQRHVLKGHKRKHTTEKPFICNMCHKGFTKMFDLNRHKLLHTGEKPFTCEVCNKGFTRKDNLNTHKLIHSGEKPFTCEVCHKGFTQKGSSARHERTHTGGKPFKCKVYHKGFTQKSDLNVHKLLHTGEKPFKCEVCDKGFTQKGNLTVHERTHTGEKYFKC